MTGSETISQNANLPRSSRSENDPECGCQRPAFWYVIQATPGGATLALNEITRRGFHVFSPMLVVERPKYRHGRPIPGIEDALEAMFPGYLFVSFDTGKRGWGEIVRAPGVAKLFSDRDQFGAWWPQPLPKGWVEALIQRGRPGDGAIAPRAKAESLTGQTMRILDGPLVDFEALCVAHSGERVTLLTEIMGRKVETKLGVHQVRKV